MFEGERKRRPINLSDAFFAEEVADSFLTPEEIELIKSWRQEVDVLEDEAGQKPMIPM